jgi:coenzyme F420-reducing hydrogenase alpha subunit
MLYAIKVDSAVVYIGKVEEPIRENMRKELEYHSRKMVEVADDAPYDFHSQLDYWRMEHREIKMELLDIGDRDEKETMEFLI